MHQIFSSTLFFNKSILISKVTTIPILKSSNPIVIWGEGYHKKFISTIYRINLSIDKDWVILIFNKVAKNGNEMIKHVLHGNAISRKENEITAIMKNVMQMEVDLNKHCNSWYKNSFQISTILGKEK